PLTIQINPAKLLLSKWTAVKPANKEKHFLVTKLIEPENEGDPLEWIELEAIYSKRIVMMNWRELKNQDNWLQGWQ
ncbi:MAG: hypothetical protein RLZ92_1954, partial [Pseudomonadota bacterium]